MNKLLVILLLFFIVNSKTAMSEIYKEGVDGYDLIKKLDTFFHFASKIRIFMI